MNLNNYIFTNLCLYLIIGYFFGSIPIGYIYCKKYDVDIFNVGSKNPGSTNVGRILGKKHGRIVFILDILKAIIPILITIIFYQYNNKLDGICCYNIFNDENNFVNTYDIIFVNKKLIILTVGLGCILGHNFSIFTKFRGGKGVTETFAIIIIFNFIYAIILFIISKLINKITNYVSLGSVFALLLLSMTSILLSIFNIYPFNFKYKEYVLIFFILYTIIGVLRHSSNIKRILNGEENKII